MLRRLAALLIRLALRTFYRRIDCVGREKLPREAPLLIVANHYNSLVDPLVLQVALPRWVTFGAAEFLFHGLLGWFMHRLGMIPIYRASDRHDPQQNLKSFRKAFELFGQGGVMALFPEGVSHNSPHVLKIKSGAARIFFGAEEHHGGRLGLRIVPVGLVYEHKDRLQGRVTVVIGDPIATDDLLALAAEAPQKATRQLTARIQAALEAVTFSQETWRDYRFIDRAVQFYLSARDEIRPGERVDLSPEQTVAVRRGMREAFLALRRRDPARLSPLRGTLNSYMHTLEVLGISDRHVREDFTPARVGRFAARTLELMVIGWPLALWGIVNNLPSYLAVRCAVTKIYRPRRDRRSTFKVFQGTLITLAVSLVQSGLVTWGLVALGWAWWWGLVYFVFLAPSAWYALSFLHRRRQALQSIRAWRLLTGRAGLREALRERRARLIAMLRALAEELRERA